MSNKRINKNKFLAPFTKFILFILHSEEPAHINVIIINNFAKPLGIHHNHLLPSLIENFFLFNIFKRCTFNCSKLTWWNNSSFNLNISFYSDISSNELGYES